MEARGVKRVLVFYGHSRCEQQYHRTEFHSYECT